MLPWDQVPPERREIIDLAAPLADNLGLLNLGLAIWAARDDTKGDDGTAASSPVRAGNQVMDSVDAMLARLYRVRARMVAERRVNEDVAMARSAALLERGRPVTEDDHG